jgi:hypothetical protein
LTQLPSFAAALLLAGCSLLIDGEQSPLRCSQEGQRGPPACDEGFVCRSNVCEIAEPVSEGGAPAASLDGDDGDWQPGDAGESFERSRN